MDEAARAAGTDPLAFRIAYVEDPRLVEVLRRVAEAHRPGIACGLYKGVSYAAVVADVAVDRPGLFRVTRLWCAHDCGLVINPDQVRAQCEGNLVWSIGMVLSDRLDLTERGITAGTFAGAPIPRLMDVPSITVALVDTSHPPTGAGETAIAAGPGAIGNPISDATGIRPLRVPVEPSTLALEA